MSAELEDSPGQGLIRKYKVERLSDPEGKHRDCHYFVLDPAHDQLARPVMRLYAQLAAAEGNLELAWELEVMIDEAQARGDAQKSLKKLEEVRNHEQLRSRE